MTLRRSTYSSHSLDGGNFCVIRIVLLIDNFLLCQDVEALLAHADLRAAVSGRSALRE
jgi:hypothetical protein